MTGTRRRLDLAGSAWPEVDSHRAVVLVPVGSLEQHGPHLPLDTDTRIAVGVVERVAETLAARGDQVWVAPALGYGSSGEHQSFPGTVSIGHEALHHVILELVRSARTWAHLVVLVNAHGGNAPTLVRAVDQLVREGHDVSWLPCRTEALDLHAGRSETSLMLHLNPGSVRLDHAVAGDTRPLPEILPLMRSAGVAAISPNGVLGDPAGASAVEGAQLLDEMTREVVEAVVARSALR